MSLMKNTNGTKNGGGLKAEAGLRLDHRQAFIVVLSKAG
jgi:hypothetical protein